MTSTPSPVSTSTSRTSPSMDGSSSSGDRTCRTISSEPVAASSRMTLSAAGSRRSEIRTTTPRPRSCAPAWRAAARRSVGPSADGDRRQRGQQAEHPPGAAQRDLAAAGPAGQRRDRDPVLRREPDVAERGGRALREHELRRTAGGHRGRAVEEEGDRDVLLLDVQLDEQLLQAGEHVPVQLPQVVAEGVVAEVGELDGLAALHRSPAALEAAANRPLHDQEQALQLAQELLVEHRGIDVRRKERRLRRARAGSRRPRLARRCAFLRGDGPRGHWITSPVPCAMPCVGWTAGPAAAGIGPCRPRDVASWTDGPAAAAPGRTGWTHGPLVASHGTIAVGETACYSTLGGGTASRIARTMASGVMPSASPSKLRITRCRRDGRVTARMSSIETLNRPSSSA